MSALPSTHVHVIREAAEAAAVLEPSRLRLMGELTNPASASELARRTGQPRQRVNYHLRELERAGLVELHEERKKGNCIERVVRASARAYLISPEVLGAIGADPARIPDRLSSAYLVATCGEAIGEVAELRGRADRAGKKLATMTLRTEVRFESARAMNAFAEELTREVARLSAKYHGGVAGERGGPAAAGEGGGRLYKFFVAGYPAITRAEGEGDGERRAEPARET